MRSKLKANCIRAFKREKKSKSQPGPSHQMNDGWKLNHMTQLQSNWCAEYQITRRKIKKNSERIAHIVALSQLGA